MCDGYALVGKSHAADISCQTSCLRTTWTSHLGRQSLSFISPHKEANGAVSSMWWLRDWHTQPTDWVRRPPPRLDVTEAAEPPLFITTMNAAWMDCQLREEGCQGSVNRLLAKICFCSMRVQVYQWYGRCVSIFDRWRCRHSGQPRPLDVCRWWARITVLYITVMDNCKQKYKSATNELCRVVTPVSMYD